MERLIRILTVIWAVVSRWLGLATKPVDDDCGSRKEKEDKGKEKEDYHGEREHIDEAVEDDDSPDDDGDEPPPAGSPVKDGDGPTNSPPGHLTFGLSRMQREFARLN